MKKSAILAAALAAMLLASIVALAPQYASADSDRKEKERKENGKNKPAVFNFVKQDRDDDDDEETRNILAAQSVTIKAKGLAIERSNDGYSMSNATISLTGDVLRREGNHGRVLLGGALDIGSQHYQIQAEGKLKLGGKVGTLQINSRTEDGRLQVHGLVVALQNDGKAWKFIADPAAKLGGHTKIYAMTGEVQLGGIVTPPPTVSEYRLTARSADLSGNSLAGLYVNLAKGGAAVAAGYTPFTFSLKSGTAYTVTVSDYQDKVFDHWEDGSTSRTRTVTLTADATITAHYRSSPPQSPTLMINAVGPDGSARHMWTTVRSGSTTVQSGYTPLNYSGSAGTTYTVTISDYQDLVFDRWENGSTDRTRTVALSSATTLTAYFKSAQSSELDHFAITTIGSQTAGGEFTFAVTAIDSAGRIKTGYAGTVTISTNNGASPGGHVSVIPSTYTFTPADAGQHVFAAKMYNAKSDTVITVSGDGKTATSNAFAVNPAPAASVTVTPSSVTLGPGGVATLSAQARDAYGNQITAATYSWSLGNLSLGTLVVSASSANTATFTAASLATTASGAVGVTATYGGATVSTSATVIVNPA